MKSKRNQRSISRVLTLTLASVLLAALTPAGASAVMVFHNGTLPANGQAAGPSEFNYRYTAARSEGSYRQVGAGAHLPGGWTMYGSYIYGWSYACHSYALGNNLGGMVHNPHTVSQYNILAFYEVNTTATC